MEQGYIKLYRQLKDKAFYYKSRYLQVWIHLLMSANHKEKEVFWNGEIVGLKAGQFITGRNVLSKTLKIPASTIEDILTFFESQQQIRQQKSNKYRIISIINWRKYQADKRNPTAEPTTNRQQSNTNNNEKNEKKIYSSNEMNELLEHYQELIRNKRSFKYLVSLVDRRVMRLALAGYSSGEIKRILDWYLTTKKSREHNSLASALSKHSLNLYEEEKAKTSWRVL